MHTCIVVGRTISRNHVGAFWVGPHHCQQAQPSARKSDQVANEESTAAGLCWHRCAIERPDPTASFVAEGWEARAHHKLHKRSATPDV